jgi:DNA recombination protein RmuC
MQEHCDFVEQESFTTESGRLRPDLIVQISGQKQIVIDSKVPLMAYLEALEITDDALRIAKLDEHARHVRRHIDQLASKQYWEQFPSAPECVVLFIPGDSLMTAAIEKDPSLIEYSMARKVVMATPMTLIALLRAVAVGWRQEQLAKNAEEISTLGKTVYERIAGTLEHFSGIGKNLSRAVKSYNDAVGTMQSRLIPAAKRFNELGVQPGREMPELEVIDIAAREVPAINAPELSPAALVEPIES